MSKRKYTDSVKQSNRTWDANNLDRMSLALPRGKKAEIQAAAGRVGESMNQYIKGAIDQRLARDKATAGADIAAGSEGETE